VLYFEAYYFFFDQFRNQIFDPKMEFSEYQEIEGGVGEYAF
jgi:hypothetical protein